MILSFFRIVFSPRIYWNCKSNPTKSPDRRPVCLWCSNTVKRYSKFNKTININRRGENAQVFLWKYWLCKSWGLQQLKWAIACSAWADDPHWGVTMWITNTKNTPSLKNRGLDYHHLPTQIQPTLQLLRAWWWSWEEVMMVIHTAAFESGVEVGGEEWWFTFIVWISCSWRTQYCSQLTSARFALSWSGCPLNQIKNVSFILQVHIQDTKAKGTRSTNFGLQCLNICINHEKH